MTLNIPLLRKTMEHIEAHPEEHDQMTWVCGTTMCFAGHAAVISGAHFVHDYGGDIVTPDGDMADIDAYATATLGLDWDQSWHLFHGCKNIPQLRGYVDELLQERP